MVDRLIGLDWLGWQVYPVLHAAWQGTMVKGFVEGTMPASGLANPVHPFLTTHTYTSYESVATMLKLKHLKACQQHCTSKNALRFLNWCIDVNTHLVKVAFVAIFFLRRVSCFGSAGDCWRYQRQYVLWTFTAAVAAIYANHFQGIHQEQHLPEIVFSKLGEMVLSFLFSFFLHNVKMRLGVVSKAASSKCCLGPVKEHRNHVPLMLTFIAGSECFFSLGALNAQHKHCHADREKNTGNMLTCCRSSNLLCWPNKSGTCQNVCAYID